MRSAFALFGVLAAMTSVAKADQLWLTMDQVRPYELKEVANSIVVGNPAIADVKVRDNQNILLFGKAPGLTNIFFFDADGEVIENLFLRVRTSPSGMLTVNRGVDRTTYNCTNNCEATVTVGDSAESFTQVSSQIAQKSGQAESAAESGN